MEEGSVYQTPQPKLRSYWQLTAERVSFLLGYGPWQVVFAPVCGPTCMYTQAAQTELPELLGAWRGRAIGHESGKGYCGGGETREEVNWSRYKMNKKKIH